MGINSILNNASTALLAQQVAINVTGQNISNVNTEGYSRQRVALESGPSTTHNVTPLGNGVHVASIQRLYDAVINNQINSGNSSLGNSDARLKALQQLEPYVNELAGNSLGDALQKFSDAWQALSLNPSGAAERQTILGRATIVTDTFHQLNDGIRNVQDYAESSIQGTTADISTKAREIASLNIQIRQTELVSGNANEVRDQRDILLKDLSKIAAVTYSEEADGTMTVKLPGGETLVSGAQYAQVYANKVTNTTNPNLPATVSEIRVTPLGFSPTTPNPATDKNISGSIGGPDNSMGVIGGLLYIRDTGMPAYLAKLDETAYNFAQMVNTQHAAGWTLNGTTGVNFFNPATATAPPATLANFAGYSSSDTTRGIRLAISSTSDIAAADTNPLTGGVGNNRNALLMAQLGGNQVTFSDGTRSSVALYYSSIVATVGVDVQSAKNRTSQNESFMLQLGNLRDSVAGVSLDEELINLTKYQKAYEGASRMVNVATQMLDTVLNMLR